MKPGDFDATFAIAMTSSMIIPEIEMPPAPQAAVGGVDAATVKLSKLMVVDDEPTNVKIVRRLLELEGFSQFVTTTDGRKAMTLIRDDGPDCVLLDLMMPFVTGLDVLDEMRHDPAT